MGFRISLKIPFGKTVASLFACKKATGLLFAAAMLSLTCCNRVKDNGRHLVATTKEKIRDTRDKAVDKIIPTFNAYTPDTKFNKKRFREFLEVEPTADVKGIYCYDDAIGIDAAYAFAFTCDDSTIQKIVKQLKLAKTVKDSALGLDFGPDLPWWDKATISTINPYWKKGPHETFWYLWYDEKSKHAYFQTYDM